MMKKILYISLFVMGVCGFSINAKAQAMNAITPEVVARIIQDAGLSYQSKFDALDRPRIIVTEPTSLKAQEFEIYFFDCEQQVYCQSITLWSWYMPEARITHARSNLWNQKNRFMKSYLDKDSQPVLEMDIQGYGGLGAENLSVLINAYIKIMPAYAKFMAVDLQDDER